MDKRNTWERLQLTLDLVTPGIGDVGTTLWAWLRDLVSQDTRCLVNRGPNPLGGSVGFACFAWLVDCLAGQAVQMSRTVPTAIEGRAFTFSAIQAFDGSPFRASRLFAEAECRIPQVGTPSFCAEIPVHSSVHVHTDLMTCPTLDSHDSCYRVADELQLV
jgi:hypothetical protein